VEPARWQELFEVLGRVTSRLLGWSCGGALADVRPKVLFQAFGQVSDGARGRYSLGRFRTLL